MVQSTKWHGKTTSKSKESQLQERAPYIHYTRTRSTIKQTRIKAAHKLRLKLMLLLTRLVQLWHALEWRRRAGTRNTIQRAQAMLHSLSLNCFSPNGARSIADHIIGGKPCFILVTRNAYSLPFACYCTHWLNRPGIYHSEISLAGSDVPGSVEGGWNVGCPNPSICSTPKRMPVRGE